MSNSLCGTTVASGRFDPLAKLSGDDRYVRTGDGWSRRILLKNSNFRGDHNSEDRWQPRGKFPWGLSGATDFSAYDPLLALAVASTRGDNAFRAEVGFSRHLNFRLFQQYRRTAVVRVLDGGCRKRVVNPAGTARYSTLAKERLCPNLDRESCDPSHKNRPAAAIALAPAGAARWSQFRASSRRDLLENRESAVIGDVFPNTNPK